MIDKIQIIEQQARPCDDNKPFAPERIFLHDPHDAFSDDSRGSLETVEWSEERVSDDDIEYVMVKK